MADHVKNKKRKINKKLLKTENISILKNKKKMVFFDRTRRGMMYFFQKLTNLNFTILILIHTFKNNSFFPNLLKLLNID